MINRLFWMIALVLGLNIGLTPQFAEAQCESCEGKTIYGSAFADKSCPMGGMLKMGYPTASHTIKRHETMADVYYVTLEAKNGAPLKAVSNCTYSGEATPSNASLTESPPLKDPGYLTGPQNENMSGSLVSIGHDGNGYQVQAVYSIGAGASLLYTRQNEFRFFRSWVWMKRDEALCRQSA